ncbi:MAG: short-chain fatty acid transporter [Armatimonadetes bacterium]|nr:short-chain fatty acid transporter [Armatimonadota bacterium]
MDTSLPKAGPPAPRVTENPLVRAGLWLADFTERWFPDAFVFALAGVVVVFLMAWGVGEDPYKLTQVFGKNFWVLIPFTMQMVLVIVGGYVVASSPPVYRLIRYLAEVPRTPRGAVGYVALLAMLSSLLSWGLSLIFTGLLVREICRRLEGVDYRAIGAASFMGLGSVWAFGLSSSAALLQASPTAMPPALLAITGVIPLTQTIFLWQSGVSALVLMVVTVVVAVWSCPPASQARTQKDFGIEYQPLTVEVEPRTRPGEWLEYSPILNVLVVLICLPYIVAQFREKGGLGALDLNMFNLLFVMAGLLLHGTPRSFLKAVAASVPATAGVIIQYPFYAGIFGMISETSLHTILGELFTALSSPQTFPLLVAAYSALLGLFVPSAGAKWIIEAPYVMAAAQQHHVHLGWTVQIYNAAEALPNMLNPFWMLPLMGILSVRARELAGYSILQLIVHTPVVFFLCWFFSRTLAYVPPSP